MPHFSDFDRRYAAIMWHVIRSNVWYRQMNEIDSSSLISIYVEMFLAKATIAVKIEDGGVPATNNSRIS